MAFPSSRQAALEGRPRPCEGFLRIAAGLRIGDQIRRPPAPEHASQPLGQAAPPWCEYVMAVLRAPLQIDRRRRRRSKAPGVGSKLVDQAAWL